MCECGARPDYFAALGLDFAFAAGFAFALGFDAGFFAI
jgi:hypothetical protein